MQTKQMLHVLALASLGLAVPVTSATAQTQAVRGTARTSDRSNDITDVQVLTDEPGITRIVVEGTHPFTPEVSSYKDNTIIALPGVWRAGRTGIRPVRQNGVAYVNCVQFSTRPKRIVRIVVSAQETLRYELKATDSPSVWEIVLRAPAAPEAEKEIAVEASIAPSKPVTLPAPENLWSTSQSTNNAAAFWAEAEFEPLARTLTPTLLALETAQKPQGMHLATPERVLGPIVALKGSGSLPPVVVTLPEAPVDSLSSLTAAAITSGKPKAAEKPAEKPAPAEKKKPESLPTPRKRSSAPVNVEKARVTLNLVDTDVPTVLKAIADQSNVNIIVGPEVKDKKVTVSLRDVTVAEALSQIASISKFEYLLKGQTFFVGSAETILKTAGDPELNAIGNEQIPFYYSNPEDLKKAVDQAFPGLTFTIVAVSSESKQVQTDPTSIGTTGAQTGPISQTVKTTPRGGVVTIMAAKERRKQVRTFVEGTESTLIKASLDEALQARMRVQGYETEIYKIRNSEPDSLIGLMKTLLPGVTILPGPTPSIVAMSQGNSAVITAGPGAGTGGGGGSQIAPQRTGTLIVTGPPDEVKMALEKLEKIDVKVPLIVYEAKLVEVNNDDKNRLGMSYDFGRNVTIGEQNFGDAGSIGASAGGAGGGGAGGGAGQPGREFNAGAIYRTPYSINAAINALATQNKARILASPTISSLDNNLANVFIGDQIKYVSNIQQTPVGQTIATEQVEAGIRLKVLGRVRPDGAIELMVHPEVSLIKNFLQLSNGVSLPQIATRFVDTTVRVKDGETIGIGGLLNEQDVETMQKVPLLGDLPFFGRLFQDRSKSKTRTELMVFITSRIVKD